MLRSKSLLHKVHGRDCAALAGIARCRSLNPFFIRSMAATSNGKPNGPAGDRLNPFFIRSMAATIIIRWRRYDLPGLNPFFIRSMAATAQLKYKPSINQLHIHLPLISKTLKLLRTSKVFQQFMPPFDEYIR